MLQFPLALDGEQICSGKLCETTPNLPTKIVDFRGFDSSIILIQRGGILMSIGHLPESLSQAMLVGIMLVGRLGVPLCLRVSPLAKQELALCKSPESPGSRCEQFI